MSKPLVSIIIPAYNGAFYLAEAIQSVLHQTYPHFEIWVIDNGSQDETAAIAQTFPQVHYLYLDYAHTARARNEGIARARGRFLAFLDQDDLWHREKLEKQIHFLTTHSSFSAVVCRQQMILEPGCTKPHWLKQQFLDNAQPAYLPSALLVKREALEKTQGFNPSFSLTSDVHWFFQAKHHGIEVELLPEVLLWRRIHPSNASHACSSIQKEILSTIRLSLRERREKISVILPVYNGEKYLAEAIESVLSQDYTHKELIVVNDGSTDSTQAIIERFGNRIRSLTQPNLGLGAARNAGIRLATGAYLAFLDHDDIWAQRKLSLQMSHMDASDPLVFSYVQQFICPSLTQQERSHLQINEEILPSHFAGNLLLSKKRFLQIGYFFEKKIVGEFIDWYLRALEAQVPTVMLPYLTLYRRIHNENIGRQKAVYNRLDYLKILKASLDRRRSHAAAP